MAAANEVDVLLRKAMKFLHSSNSNSATEIRLLLDEAIKQRYGPEKMLCNTLSQRHLDEEPNFPGRAITPPPQPPVDEVINLTSPPSKTLPDSPETIVDSDDNGETATTTTTTAAATIGSSILSSTDDDVNLREFGDLNCCVCSVMMFTATNRLIECSKCGALYHQECHKPPITDEEASESQEHSWQCDTCCNKPSTSKAAGILVIPDEPMPLVAAAKPQKTSTTSSRSSSCSNSSSPFYKQEQSSPTTSKHHSHRSSSSKSSHKEERSKGAAAIGVAATSEKSSSSSSSSSRKSTHSSSSKSSSSSRSKHHESGGSGSSGSKRKSNK